MCFEEKQIFECKKEMRKLRLNAMANTGLDSNIHLNEAAC